MSSRKIRWFPEPIFLKNVEATGKMYEFLERDFSECLEYVALNENHFSVYSFRLADLVLRAGPEIFRVLDLIFFNKNITPSFMMNSELEDRIISLQKKKEDKRDKIIDYLDTYKCYTGDFCVRVKALEKYIIPFERKSVILPNKRKPSDSIQWWELGYNALRHRVVFEFEKAATLKNALFSLAGLWILCNTLNSQSGINGMPGSNLFDIPIRCSGTQQSEVLSY
jgi:hypothetical protein